MNFPWMLSKKKKKQHSHTQRVKDNKKNTQAIAQPKEHI